ncbi:Phage tail fiber repeat protein [compost metagenome]
MAKTDWSINDVVRPQDMNDIGAELNQLREDVDNIEIPPASTTQAGIVQLSNATDGTRENVAATEKAVGMAFQAGNERKAELVAALVAKGIAATTSETWAQLIDKVTALVKATGNATAAQLLSGATASNASGPITGAMPNQGAKVITPSTVNQTIVAGYHNGSGYVAGDADLIAANIRSGVNIFGVLGTLIEGKQSQSGSTVGDNSSEFKIRGLPFKPNIIAYWYTQTDYYGVAIDKSIIGEEIAVRHQSGTYSTLPYTFFEDGFNVTSGAIAGNVHPWNWLAIKW